jgi:hypothetical protein
LVTDVQESHTPFGGARLVTVADPFGTGSVLEAPLAERSR